jgi:formylglycine-generating enzyme required for sulfatase activity
MMPVGLVVVIGGCDLVLGLERASAIDPDAGTVAGTTASSSASSTSSGAGGSTSSSSASSSGTGGSGIVCVPGQKQCAGNVPQLCDADGMWQSAAECHLYCSGGECANPPSCIGLPETCGLPGSNENCCASSVAVGGTFKRSNDPAYPATVSNFRLDRFEITVGRFRAFVNAYPGNKPKAGAGAHPNISGSGWDSAWDANLPAGSTELATSVKCSAEYQTWTDMPGANEDLPIDCLDWYQALAFCAWDGGRLPTEAEWNYAAAGGNEQRQYPWSIPPSSLMIDSSYAVYAGASLAVVGSKSAKGNGKWGQADLAGSVNEWTLDWMVNPYLSCTAGNDCANTTKFTATDRVVRGGYWGSNESYVLSDGRGSYSPNTHYLTLGARCARTP